MTRLNVVRFLAASLALSLLASWAKIAFGEDNKSPLFTFAHITDTHCLTTTQKPEEPPAIAFFEIGGYKYHWKDLPNSFPILENTIDYINHTIKPDFVIHTGDLTEYGNPRDLEKTKGLLDKLDCSCYPVMGDHDLGTSFPAFDKNRSGCNYVRVFGQRCYSFDHANWHMVIVGIYPNQEELEWLKNDLAKNKDKPTIVCTHRLIIADQFTLDLAKKHLGVSLLMPKAEEVGSILKSHPNVVLVLSGHCHSNFRWDKYGMAFISTSALLEVPHQFKVFEVYRDKIEVSLFTANRAKDVEERQWRQQQMEPIKLK